MVAGFRSKMCRWNLLLTLVLLCLVLLFIVNYKTPNSADEESELRREQSSSSLASSPAARNMNSAERKALPAFCVRCSSLALEKELSHMEQCKIIEQSKESWAFYKKDQSRESVVPGWYLSWSDHQRALPVVKFNMATNKAEILSEDPVEYDSRLLYARYPIAPLLFPEELQLYSTFWRLNISSDLFSRMRIYETPVKYGELAAMWNSSQQARFKRQQPWYQVFIREFREDYSEFQNNLMANFYFKQWKQLADATAKTTKRLSEEAVRVVYTYNHSATIPPLRTFLHKFNKHIIGKRGVILGSQNPWLEYEVLLGGAGHVTTLEYLPLDQAIPANHPHMAYLHPKDLEARMSSNGNVSYDFAMTFSSIEHTGLGRYSDPLNPDGDFMELAKLSCIVKPGGLLFLGVPVASDCLLYSLHRMYGPIRYSLISECWKVIEFSSFDLIEVCTDNPSAYTQPWFVLQNLRGCAIH